MAKNDKIELLKNSTNQRDSRGKFVKGMTSWKKGKYDICPNIEMSETLAYILGVIKGDGYFTKHKGSWLVGLHVKSPEFIEKFRECLKKISLNPSVISVTKELSRVNKKEMILYRTTAYSNKFYDFYKDLSYNGIFDLIKNSDRLIYSFIQGFYESDGSARKRKRHGVGITLSKTNYDLINLTAKLLNKIDIKHSIHIYKRENNWKDLYTINILGASSDKIKFLNKLNPIIRNLRGEIDG